MLHISFPHFIACLAGAFLLMPQASWAAVEVSFRKEIAPILQRRCVACHGEESAKGGYRLDSLKRMAKTGESELPALTPGQAQKSELYKLLVETDAEDRMPQKAEALPPEEIALIEKWINQGAPNDGGAPDRSLAELVRESLLLPAPHNYPRPVPATALAFSPDGTQLAAAGFYEITIWKVDSGTLVRRVGGMPERITAIAWNAKRNLIAAAGGSPAQWGSVWLIEPGKDFNTRLLCDLSETSLSVAFSPDGKKLVAGCGDRTIRIFDTASGKPGPILKTHSDWVQTVAFGPDGARFISASRDRTVRIFDGANGEVLTTYDGHDAAVLSAILPLYGTSAYSVARGQAVRQWDSATGKLQAEFPDAGRDVQLILSTDAGILAASSDGELELIQSSDRSVFMRFYGHRDYIESLALAPDRRVFASGDHRGVICVWTIGCEAPRQQFIAKP